MRIFASDYRHRRPEFARSALALFALVATAGCQVGPPRPVDAASCVAPAAGYLEYARALSATDPAGRERAHQAALAEFRLRADPPARIRLALAASFLEPLPEDTTQTRVLFRDLLQDDPPPAPGLAALLEMRLNEMDARLEAQRRVARQQAELDAAEAKIQALTTIEKTLEPPGGKRGR